MQSIALKFYFLFQVTLCRYPFIDLLLFEPLFSTLNFEAIPTHFLEFYCFLSSMLFSLFILMLEIAICRIFWKQDSIFIAKQQYLRSVIHTFSPYPIITALLFYFHVAELFSWLIFQIVFHFPLSSKPTLTDLFCSPWL